MEQGKPGEANETMPLYTASAVNFQATAWVLRLGFGEVDVAPPGQLPGETYRVAIGLPWPLAKIFHAALGAAIEAYEKQEGEISVPKTVKQRLDAGLLKSEK